MAGSTVALILAITALAGADEAPVKDLRYYLQQASAAHEKKDVAGFLENYQRAAELAPRNLRVLYNLACAHALNGKAEAAAASLVRLADLQVYFEPARDADFEAVQASPAFQAVVKRFEALQAPVGSSSVAFTLPERDLIPEGISRDPTSGNFLISSVRKRKVLWVSSRGGSLLTTPGQDGLWSALGLAIDPRRRIVWVGSAALPQMVGFNKAEQGRSGLFGFDYTGPLVRKVLLSGVGQPHNLGDLAVDSQGAVYASDSVGSAIYRLPPAGAALETFIEPGQLGSPQGLAFSPDEKTLYVADYSRGLASIDVASRKVTLLEPPESMVLVGIDGLQPAPGGLVAIQNGIRPNRVLHLALESGAVKRGTILEMNNPHFDEPTAGVVAGNDFYYVANSHWNRFREDGSLPPAAELSEPVILRLTLPH